MHGVQIAGPNTRGRRGEGKKEGGRVNNRLTFLEEES